MRACTGEASSCTTSSARSSTSHSPPGNCAGSGQVAGSTRSPSAVRATTPPAPDCASVAGTKTDRKSTRLNSSHLVISYAVFCLKKKKPQAEIPLVCPYTSTPHLSPVSTRSLLCRDVDRTSTHRASLIVITLTYVLRDTAELTR